MYPRSTSVISLDGDGDGVLSPSSVAVATTVERRTGVVVNARVIDLFDVGLISTFLDDVPDVDAIPSPHPHPPRNVPAHARTPGIAIDIDMLLTERQRVTTNNTSR